MRVDELNPEEWFKVRHVRDTGEVFFECSSVNPVVITWLIAQAAWAWSRKNRRNPREIMDKGREMLEQVLTAEEMER